ncbi:MAG: PQQ-dependent sugar dehydrogenase [Candidatus Cyclobacteriaceae bacterium M2_1C_046]
MWKIFSILIIAILFFSCSKSPRVLIYNTDEVQEKPASITFTNEISKRLTENEIEVISSKEGLYLTEDSLKDFNAIVLLDLNPQKLNSHQQNSIERFVQSGGSLLALNISTDSIRLRYQWPWYGRLLQRLDLQNIVKTVSTEVEPIILPYDNGQFYYTSTDLKNEPSNFTVEKISAVALKAAGGEFPDYQKATSLRMPDENRFIKVVLDNDLNEPMQMAVLPDQRVLFIEREGPVKLYNPKHQKTRLLANFKVSTEGNYEDGMLGITADPDFSRNGWIYIYYSPPGPEPKQNLSRFLMVGDSLILSSEKVIMEVPVQRETCCHSAGGLEFGPDGLLYISTGDNTSSKESNGYTPIDERPGRSPFDAQKSSSNTNDLRGKILRIKVNSDGSYSIPENNLFAKNEPDARPEIYVMGVRNPFRFTIDPATNFLYWGDVGPDGGEDGIQGPQSYDEWNQAKAAGNFGWPYFVGNNKMYPDWDFSTNKHGDYLNPEKPINESPNNTGKKILPTAQAAMIWYPYGESQEFPMLGKGSRSAMGGPFYHENLYGPSSNKFPLYYSGKWFIYEWARSWIQVVSFDENYNIEKIEPFLPKEDIVKPIDMRFGPEGALYILEYGANYFANNDEARLIKIFYNEGNKAPVAKIKAEKTVGAAPFTVELSAGESFDYEDEQLEYQWYFNSEKVKSADKETTFTFNNPGIHNAKLVVTDPQGLSSEATLKVAVGNEPPVVEVYFEGNRSFYHQNKKLSYNIRIHDKEDGELVNYEISEENAAFNFNYLDHGLDLALISPGEANISPSKYLLGKQLIENSDCRSCHTLEKASVGPTYKDIALHYKGDYSAVEFLSKKIIKGGGGVWGDALMAAHPQHTEEDATEMTKYILSLADDKPSNLPLHGIISFDKHEEQNEDGLYILSVAYTDKGANNIPPITERKSFTFRHPKVQAENYDAFRNVQQQRPNGGNLAYVSEIRHGSHIVFNDIDLTAIKSITYNVSTLSGGNIECRIGSPDGPVVSETTVSKESKNDFNPVDSELKITKGVHDIYFVFKNEEKKEEQLMNLDWIQFHEK